MRCPSIWSSYVTLIGYCCWCWICVLLWHLVSIIACQFLNNYRHSLTCALVIFWRIWHRLEMRIPTVNCILYVYTRKPRRNPNSNTLILLGNQAAPHCMQAFHPRGTPWTVTKCFPRFSWEGSLLGTLTDINEGINHWLWRWSFPLCGDPVGEHGGGLIYWGLWGKGVEESSGDGCLSP